MTGKMSDSQMVSHLRTKAHWTRPQPWTDIANRLEELSENSSTEKEQKYVIITTVSTHRMRYAIPVSDLDSDDPIEQIEWAKDSVTMEEAEEFSQHWLGETVSDATILDEKEMLELYDLDNDWAASWSKEQKLNYVKKWKREKEL